MFTFAIVYFVIGFLFVGTLIYIGITDDSYKEMILFRLRTQTRIESIVWVFKVILNITGAIIGWPYFLIICIKNFL